ncbi:hypothetical protein BH11VER1_BH11VER1_26130 [soil metagenome]
MIIGLDTSVLVRLLVGSPPEMLDRAVAYLDELRLSDHEAVASDLAIAEAYFALQHHYQIPKKVALASLHQLFASGMIGCSPHTLALLALPSLDTAKPGFVDRLIHAGYTKNADGMATFEKSAKKLPRTLVL